MILSFCLQQIFESQHMDIDFFPHIYEWRQPNKKLWRILQGLWVLGCQLTKFSSTKNFIGVQLVFWKFSWIASPILSYLGRNNHLEGNMYNCSMLLLPSHLICKFLIFWFFFKMSMVEDVMTLVRMMYRLILNQDCDQMELNPHLLLFGHVFII